jgi:hypothetical protein
MKITVTLEEAMRIVGRHIIEIGGVPIADNSGKVVSHIEGQYDDAQQVEDKFSFDIIVDGFSFDII